MPKFQRVTSRTFTEFRKYIGIGLFDIMKHENQVSLTPLFDSGNVPESFDTIYSQNIHIVMQSSEKVTDYFNPNKPGILLVIKGFKIEINPVFAINKSTNEIVLPPVNLKFTGHEIMYGEYHSIRADISTPKTLENKGC